MLQSQHPCSHSLLCRQSAKLCPNAAWIVGATTKLCPSRPGVSLQMESLLFLVMTVSNPPICFTAEHSCNRLIKGFNTEPRFLLWRFVGFQRFYVCSPAVDQVLLPAQNSALDESFSYICCVCSPSPFERKQHGSHLLNTGAREEFVLRMLNSYSLAGFLMPHATAYHCERVFDWLGKRLASQALLGGRCYSVTDDGSLLFSVHA